MKDGLKSFLTFLVIIIAISALGFVATSIDFANLKFWGVKYENAHREIFEQTKSYNQGKTQQLAKYYVEWKDGDEETKATIKFTIRHQFADYNADRLEPGLSNFLIQMRGY